MMVSAGRKETALHVKTLEPAIRVAGKSLELWGVPRRGAPRSLGVVQTDKAELSLPASADQADRFYTPVRSHGTRGDHHPAPHPDRG